MKIWLPTFDMQFIWYIHLVASPYQYIDHCCKLLNQILSLTHLNDVMTSIQERYDSWQRMHEIIFKRKYTSIFFEGGMYRGDPSETRLSNLLLQRTIKEYEGFYPKEVKIIGSFGRGWQAKIDRIHLSVTPLSPPCPPTTMMRRFQNMDIEDKIEEDRVYEENDMVIAVGKRMLHRLNLASKPRIKRLCLLTGGMRVSTLLTTEGMCLEFHLKNDLVATVHSLTSGQFRHGMFDSHCIHCINSKGQNTVNGGAGPVESQSSPNTGHTAGGSCAMGNESAGTTTNNGGEQQQNSQRFSPNESMNGTGTNKCECQVFLLRIAGIDHALIHGAWSNPSSSSSNNNGNTAVSSGNGNTTVTGNEQEIGTNGSVGGSSKDETNASTTANSSNSMTNNTISGGVGVGGVGAASFGLENLNLNLIGETSTLPSFTFSPNVVTSYPMISIYNLPFQEMRVVNVMPSNTTVTSGNKRQLHAFQYKSICRLLGYDNVEDNVTIDMQQGYIQGERNAPPVMSIALGMTIALMHITLRPEEYCPIQDDVVNPFLLALGGLLPGDEALKEPFPSFAALFKSSN
jgi:hypothetical protein